MAKTNTKTLLRARFAELRAERDTVEAELLPLNERLREIREESTRAEAEILEQKKPLAARMGEIDLELSSLNAALVKRQHNGVGIGSTKD